MEEISEINFVDLQWIELLEKAVAYQQNFYELLPHWMVCKKNNYQLIKQNIGYAICNTPIFTSSSDSKNILYIDPENKEDNTNISDLVCYCPEMEKIICVILQKIMQYSNQYNDSIHYGIIYNVIIRNKITKQSKKENKDEIMAVPVFKIKYYNESSKSNEDYTVWYIDIQGRIYKCWEDYILNNNFPKCTMVYPKDGYYQPNPDFEITSEGSTVWLIAKDSYESSSHANIMSIVNSAVNTVGISVAVGVGVASLFTPVGPLVTMAGMSAMTAQGVWTIGKCTVELYDKAIHEESISPFDKSNLSLWLGIAGSTVGIVYIGNTVLLQKASAEGIAVSRAAMMAYDVTLVSNISINLIGIGYKSVQIYNKYKESGKFTIQDVVYLGTHLLFFMNSVINIKFAKDIIETTQGEVFKEFEENIRNDNFRQHYENAKKKATNYNTNKIEENAAIIRYMKYNTMNDIIRMSNNSLITTVISSLSFVEGKIKIKGITLLDPMSLIIIIGRNFLRKINKSNSQSTDESKINQSKCADNLVKILKILLANLYMSGDIPNTEKLPNTNNFKFFIDELKQINKSEDILPVIFNIAVTILKNKKKLQFLVEACYFVWDYIKTHIEEKGYKIYTSSENSCEYRSYTNYMTCLCVSIFEAVDSMVQQFFNAFQQYIIIINKNSSQKYHKI